MRYRRLGRTPLSVSEIGYGCMSLGDDDTANQKLLLRAVDAGINYFDTADIYQKGLNESIVGKALKEKRDKVIIATKVGNQWREDGSGWDWNPSKKYILGAAEKSLQRLQTDYIDLYQLHGGTIDDPIEETIEAFELLQQQGKIRYYGISSIRPNVIREYVERSAMISVMMQYSLLDRRPEETCLDLLHQNNIAILARGTLAKGLLIDKGAEPFLNYSAADVRKASSAIAAVAQNGNGKTAAALGYVLTNPAVASAVTGIRTNEQLEDIIKSSHHTRLTTEEIELLRKSINVNYYTEHR